MGTSAKYGGPGAASALIPSFLEVAVPPAPPKEKEEEKDDKKPTTEQKPNEQPRPSVPVVLPPLPAVAAPGRFRTSRSNFNTFASSGNQSSLRKSLSSYVSKGTGGGRTATRRMGASISSVRNAIGFVQGI